jgi:hypothetical protein
MYIPHEGMNTIVHHTVQIIVNDKNANIWLFP